ncbi:MAG: hypothetical protein ACT4NU_01945 [Chromatiales bacterium]
MKRRQMVLWSIVLMALLAPRLGSAYNLGADEDFSYLGLRGIRAVAVQFDGFYGDYQRYGVDEGRLRAAVERRLQESGISVLSTEEVIRTAGAALMRVDMRANYGTYGYYSYAVSVKIKQKIALAGGPDSFVTETVWSRGTGGWVYGIQLDRVNREIAGLVEQFLVEHRAQNGVSGTAEFEPATP